jgi:acetyl esterase/lipase
MRDAALLRNRASSAFVLLAAHHALSRLRTDPESVTIGNLPRRVQQLIRDYGGAPINLCTSAVAPLLFAMLQPRALRCVRSFTEELAPGLCLDVFKPPELSPGQGPPILIYVHGGAWTLGGRDHYSALGRRLAHEGWVAVIVGYPLWPAADAAAQVASVRTALEHTKQRGVAWGADPARVYLSGQSSGAHVCAMSLLGPPDAPARCAGLIGMAGPYDLVAHTAFEARRGLDAFSPMPCACHPLDEHSPTLLVQTRQWLLACERVLLVHGERDATVPPSSSALFALALARGGQRAVEYAALPEDGHMSFLSDLALGLPAEPLLGRLKQFCGCSGSGMATARL